MSDYTVECLRESLPEDEEFIKKLEREVIKPRLYGKQPEIFSVACRGEEVLLRINNGILAVGIPEDTEDYYDEVWCWLRPIHIRGTKKVKVIMYERSGIIDWIDVSNVSGGTYGNTAEVSMEVFLTNGISVSVQMEIPSVKIEEVE